MAKSVLVLGGTGFIGESIVDSLINDGFRPLVLIRNKNKIKEEWVNKCDFLYGNAQELNDHLTKISEIMPIATVYSIGLIREKGNQKFIDFHYNWAKIALEVSKNTGIEKFIYISANGVKAQGTNYQTTKYKFEKELENTHDNYLIVRPSLVWGDSKKYNFKHELDRLTRFIFTPVFGNGKYKIAPIEREEIGITVLKFIKGEIESKILQLCGNTEYTFDELLLKYAKSKNRRILLIHIPLWLIVPVISTFERFSWFPITKDQLLMLLEENIC
jgi:uncharacterized protein YbjT (DUF2867 family)